MRRETPDLVRFETPRGETALGEVVDEVYQPSISGLGRLLVVKTSAGSYRVPCADATPV